MSYISNSFLNSSTNPQLFSFIHYSSDLLLHPLLLRSSPSSTTPQIFSFIHYSSDPPSTLLLLHPLLLFSFIHYSSDSFIHYSSDLLLHPLLLRSSPSSTTS
ncbi:hypothetical protein CDAR_229331 [Caerostris darwini]|uniref:Uncharacterized protein n=1 Tax=Caerostris darwini TaxID=1538125 RepID=A0AAV4PY04_9ARAC|nr:hypothetical protein CDAR_229331 [Caerostris darwini]